MGSIHQPKIRTEDLLNCSFPNNLGGAMGANFGTLYFTKHKPDRKEILFDVDILSSRAYIRKKIAEIAGLSDPIERRTMLFKAMNY
ncbi:MAG: hypothetical protein EOO96_12345 [Pedobacter sp.]|nr:MAG: hypothetical protein EOO96_12345 [Pedobacter sp.]